MAFTVSGSIVVAFADAVLAALQADVALVALVRSITAAPSRGTATALPYIRLGNRDHTGDGFAMGKAGGDIALQVDIFSSANGPYEASRIAGEVRRVLARRNLTVTGFALMQGSVQCETDLVFEEADPDMPERAIYHAVQRWTALIEES